MHVLHDQAIELHDRLQVNTHGVPGPCRGSSIVEKHGHHIETLKFTLLWMAFELLASDAPPQMHACRRVL